MMRKVSICLVGAGGMGSRHVGGMAVLAKHGLSNLDLVAVCDLRADNAERVATQAEQELGSRPRVHLSVDSALQDKEIDAFIVVTEAFSHFAVVPQILRVGKHVLCEKPLALTVRSCQALEQAARDGGAILATAENYRRDPPNRLAKAVIDAGLIGTPHLMLQTLVGGGNGIVITPWRHMKDKGAIGLDMAVHFTDLLRFYLGEIDSMFGKGFIAEPIRYRRAEPELKTDAYLARFKEMPTEVLATGEDSVLAYFAMQSGAVGQLSYIHAGPVHRGHRSRTIHGNLGWLDIPNDRTGNKVVLRTDAYELSGREILQLLPDFTLDPVTAAIFGAEGVEYDLAPGAADAALLAIEQHDFCKAILDGGTPEVSGFDGTAAVAGVVGVYESGIAGHALAFDDVLSGRVDAYQRDIDTALGLIGDASRGSA